MKIEIFLVDSINENCTGMTCFNANEYISNIISNQKEIQGVILINKEVVKFNFSPMGMDGDIFTDNDNYISIVKSLIPLYVLNNIK